MNSKEYFKSLLSILHESDAADAIDREMKETPTNLDAGDGLQDPELENYPETQEGNDESATADENMEGLDDASYMQAPVDPAIDDITKRQRNTKLFDNFSDLQKMVEYFVESLDSRVSLDLLDNKQTEIISFSKDRMKSLIEKIINYQQNSFLTRQYEENIYMFMLLRSEFLTIIKYIRKILKITQTSKNPNEKIKKN